MRASLSTLIALVGVAVASSLPSLAAATPLEEVATVSKPNGSLVMRGVSRDGGRLLLQTGTKSSLWLVNSNDSTSQLLTQPGKLSVSSLAPNGRFVAWAEQSCRPSKVYVARTTSPRNRRRIALIGRSKRLGIVGMTVASSGRVTALVVDKRACKAWDDYSTEPRAILSARPGAKRFKEVARTRRGFWTASTSPDGRVFALCGVVRQGDRPNSALSQLTVVRSDPHLRIKRGTQAQSPYTRLQCSVSDSGSGTMLVPQHVPGRGFSERPDFRAVGVSVGRGRQQRFSLPPGTATWGLEAVSPTGNRALIIDHTGTLITIVHVRSGHRTKIRLPKRFRRNSVWGLGGGGGASACYPSLLDCFGAFPGPGGEVTWQRAPDQLVFLPSATYRNGSEPQQKQALMLAPGSKRWTRPMKVSTNGFAQACPLPSGRVLLASGRFSRDRSRFSRLFLSGRGLSLFREINVRSASRNFMLNCEAARSGHVFLAAVGTGKIYRASPDAFDGSSLVLR